METENTFVFSDQYTKGIFARLGIVQHLESGKAVLDDRFFEYYRYSAENYGAWLVFIDAALREPNKRVWKEVEDPSSCSRHSFHTNSESLRRGYEIFVMRRLTRLVPLLGTQTLGQPYFRLSKARNSLKARLKDSFKSLDQLPTETLEAFDEYKMGLDYLRDMLFGWKYDQNLLAILPQLLASRLGCAKVATNQKMIERSGDWVLTCLISFGIRSGIYTKDYLPLVRSVFDYQVEKLSMSWKQNGNFLIGRSKIFTNPKFWAPIWLAALFSHSEVSKSDRIVSDVTPLSPVDSLKTENFEPWDKIEEEVKSDVSNIVYAHLFNPEYNIKDSTLILLVPLPATQDVEKLIELLLEDSTELLPIKRAFSLCLLRQN